KRRAPPSSRRSDVRPRSSVRRARSTRPGSGYESLGPWGTRGGERMEQEEFPHDPEIPVDVEPRVRHVQAVAGSRGGVGSSLVAVNLAVYLAQLGRTVALIDA